MQYILSQEEMDEVNQLRKDVKVVNELFKREAKLQRICTKAANEWPVKYWGRKEAEPWGCKITMEKNKEVDEWYCDNCPVQEICPYPFKGWSK